MIALKLPGKISFVRRSPKKGMTICIAASCLENDEPRIVFCKDWRGEVPNVGSYDGVQKLRRISSNWIALVANNLARAEELCIRYEYHAKSTVFSEEHIVDELRKVFSEYKKSMADSFLQNRYGISLEQLINQGMGAFGEKFVSGCFDDIARMPVDADLLIAGFVTSYDYERRKDRIGPIICSVSERNEGDPVVMETEFGVIGSGGNVARSMMLSREQDSVDPLMRTIYNVFEAKYTSEMVPGVGSTFSIEVFYPDGTLKTLSDEGFKRCKALFARFGPRSTDIKKSKEWFKVEDGYLESFASDA